MNKGQKLSFKRKMPPMSDAHKLAISNANKGHKVSDETKSKIGNANRGKVYGEMPQEYRDNISKALKGKMPKFIPNNKGRKLTQAHKDKIREARKDYRPTKETKLKNSLSHRGEKNYNWQHENVSYQAVHAWIRKQKGSPRLCEHCGTTKRKYYHWANKSQEYKRELSDWLRLCVPCHSKYDREYHKNYGI